MLANVLDRLVSTNSGVDDRSLVTKFSAAKSPAISLMDYLER